MSERASEGAPERVSPSESHPMTLRPPGASTKGDGKRPKTPWHDPGAEADARPVEPPSFDALLHDATQLLEQAAVTGASLAGEP